MRPSWKRADRPLIACETTAGADRLARRTAIGLACALVALLPAAVPAEAATASSGGDFTRAMLRELNRVRASHKLDAVREDRPMDRAAFGHSRDMARRSYFAHGSWSGRVMAAAGSARSVGEVIGWRVQSSPRSEASNMVHDWLNSPPHRHVLLSDRFDRIGIGRATAATPDGHPTALYTVDFAG